MREEEVQRRMEVHLRQMRAALEAKYARRVDEPEIAARWLHLQFFFADARSPASQRITAALMAHKHAQERLGAMRYMCAGPAIFTSLALMLGLVRKRVYSTFTVTEAIGFFGLFIGILPFSLYPLYARLLARDALAGAQRARQGLVELCAEEPHRSMLASLKL